MSLFIAALGSGSAGNCYLFDSGGTRLLVDAGLGPRETDKRLRTLGRTLDSVDAILLTHEHSDHLHGAEKIARKFGIPIYLTEGTLMSSRISRVETPTVTFENNRSFRIGDVEVHARRTVHDAADPACFVIESGDGTRVGLATDLGHVDDGVREHLRRCDALFFESNHDLDMLRMGSYPWSLKRRIMSRYGHLSNDDAMSALLKLVDAELKAVCMIHLSEKNNHETIVRSMTSALLTKLGVAPRLEIARQSVPVALGDISRTASPLRPTQLRLF